MEPDTSASVSHASKLAQANDAVQRAVPQRRDRWYPAYHIAAEAGWINDPNGLCFYKGRYHVFFQHHPYGVEWGPMHWGHASSKDLVTWRAEPIALAPSLEADRDGCWSGSCVVGQDGRLYAFYTGNSLSRDPNSPLRRRQTQCVAVSDDGINFNKLGVVVPGIEPMEYFRDPKVWLQDDTWCMVVGQRSAQNHGQIALYTSTDLLAWDYSGVIYEHPDPDVYMLECPDLFELQGSWILCFSAMGMKPKGYVGRNANNAVYVVGNWKLGDTFEAKGQPKPCDAGHNYYAPQSFEAPDGRRIQFGWMHSFQFEAAEQEDGWCGQLTLPRELALKDGGIVAAQPAGEVSQILTEPREWKPFVLAANERRLMAHDLRCGYVELTLDLASSDAERAGIEVHRTPDGSHLYVAYDAQTSCIVVDRRATKRGNRGYRAAPIQSDAEQLKIHVWLDRGSIEVYANDGEQVLSELSYPSEDPCAVVLASEAGQSSIASFVLRELA